MQFAAIRTDVELNPLGEPLQYYCRPVEDILPQPEAVLVTGITPQQARAKGLDEPAFIRLVEAEMLQSQTCVVGYNSIRFDDEVTRFTLYRNFRDPYAREWRNGNSRWDIIDMLRLVYALKPASLNWPEREPGVPSFKLEALTQANGIAHTAAHDALADVEATIELARLVKHREPALFDFCWQLRLKDQVLKQLHLGEARPLLHISSRYPASRGCLAIVAPLVRLKSNSNAVVVLDLEQDPSILNDLDAETLRQRVFSPAAELPVGQQRISLKLLHLNRSPILVPVASLSSERAQELGIDRDRCERNWQRLGNPESWRHKLEAVFAPFGDLIYDPELALYQGFIPDADRLLCDQVASADSQTLATQTFPFQDARLGELLFRYRARFFPDSLSRAERASWHEQVQQRLFAEDSGDSRTLAGFRARIEQLAQELGDDPRAAVLLGALAQWGQELQQKYSQA